MASELPTGAEVFHSFLSEQIRSSARELSPEELLRIWRSEHAETVEDIRLGIRNMEAGRGRSLEDVDADIRKRHGFGHL